MKFSTREDIDRPIAEVYAFMANFEGFEERIKKRGIKISRMPGVSPPDIGTSWEAPVEWRGRRYDIAATLVNVEPDVCYGIEGKVGGVESLAVVDLVALAKSKTRMFVSLELTPTTLSSRIMLQSLKLTKGSLTKRFKSRVAALADEIRNGASGP